MIKSTFLFLGLIFNSSLFAQEEAGLLENNFLKDIMIKSMTIVGSTESCENILTNHIALVDESEKYIATLSDKDSDEITPFEVATLQKILTNRYAHLDKAIEAYRNKDELKGCTPNILGEAIAIYDFGQFGGKSLHDPKLRRIIYNFTKFSKYNLTHLKKMYRYYTSPEFLEEFNERLEALQETIPSFMDIKSYEGTGHFRTLPDILLRGTISFASGVTKVWGFISDKLIWRKGRLNGDQEALRELKANLKPLDLLFEKRNFTLTNYTIPGHWGHVAIWLGTKEELIANGMWDKDFFIPFKQAIEEGKNIIEIRKKGVQFVSLEHFMNLDEVGVTRIKSARNQMDEIFRNLASEMDAPYDFSFNAQTPDKLTCTELVAYTYGNIRWPEYETFIQVSLRPDDVGILSLYDDTPEEFILYLKGHRKAPFEKIAFEGWKKLFNKKVKKLNKQFEEKLNAIRASNIER